MDLVWDDLRVLLAVQRARSLGGAARTLAVDATTVGRRLRALETAVGARMFDRSADGLSPTDAGTTVIAHAERVEAEIEAATRAAFGLDARVSGTVRVTAGDGLVGFVLVPELENLRRIHPDLVVDLRGDARALDLSRREADVAIRLARPKEAPLVARRVGTARFALYASRKYLDRHGTPKKTADLAAHAFAGAGEALDDLPQHRWLARTVRPLRYAVRASSTTMQVLACAEGLGIALLPTYAALREPRLVPVLPRLVGPSREMWLVVHEDMKKNARVEATSRWLAEVVQRACA